MEGVQLAELAAVGKLLGELKIGDAAPLGAGLEDPAEMVHGVGQGLAISDGQAAGLHAVDVLAGPGREDRRQRMPAVTGGDGHKYIAGRCR